MTQKIEDADKLAILRRKIAGSIERYELLSRAACEAGKRPGREAAPADVKDGDGWFVPPTREQQARIDAWGRVAQDLKTLVRELERGKHFAAATEINIILDRVRAGEWAGVLSDWRAVETGLRAAEARSRRGDETGESGAKPRPEAGTPTETAGPEYSHSPDFTSVMWYGTRYTFAKGNQARVVKALWDAWEAGGHSLTQETVGERIGSTASRFELAKAFRRKLNDGGCKPHPAWGTMIQSDSKGSYRLVPPESA